MPNPEPFAPMGAARAADIGDARVRRIMGFQIFDGRGHTPDQRGQFPPAIGVAHHRRRAVGIDIDRRLEIADAVMGGGHEIPDRLLIGCNAIQVAHRPATLLANPLRHHRASRSVDHFRDGRD